MKRALVRALSSVLDWIDTFQRDRPWLAVPVAVVRKLAEDGGSSLAALIAYYGLLAIFPLILSFAAILGFVLAADPALEARVLQTIEASFPALAGFIDKTVSGSGTALGFGLAFAIWAGLGVVLATERAMNAVWDVPLSERPNALFSRLRALAMLGVLALMFLVSTGVSAITTSNPLLAIPLDVAPLALNVALYLSAFAVLTNRRLSVRDLLPGSILGAVCWTALQKVGGIYVRHEVARSARLYGSLAAVIGLIAWIYLGAQLTIIAAELNAVLHGRLWPRSLRGGAQTDADRRSRLRQARELERGHGERIDVTFAEDHEGPDEVSPGVP